MWLGLASHGSLEAAEKDIVCGRGHKTWAGMEVDEATFADVHSPQTKTHEVAPEVAADGFAPAYRAVYRHLVPKDGIAATAAVDMKDRLSKNMRPSINRRLQKMCFMTQSPFVVNRPGIDAAGYPCEKWGSPTATPAAAKDL